MIEKEMVQKFAVRQNTCRKLRFILCGDVVSGVNPLPHRVKSFENNPLPDDKIFALPKLKAFADDNFSVTHSHTFTLFDAPGKQAF